MAVAENLARQALMACSDGAVQVSNPAWGPRLTVRTGGGGPLGVAETAGEALPNWPTVPTPPTAVGEGAPGDAFG